MLEAVTDVTVAVLMMFIEVAWKGFPRVTVLLYARLGIEIFS